MSRCFPFPPPGYLRNSARRDALIESIKLRKDEMEKASKEREEKKARKDKKRETKKEKKERKQKGSTTSHSNDVAKKLKLIDQTEETKAVGKLQKVENSENELCERSGITEEHEQPASYRDPCSSDSSQNSKRKRDASLPPSHDHVPAIRRIRLPLRKHREPEEPKQESQLGSSSGNAVTLTEVTRSDGQLQCIKKVETKQCPGNSDSIKKVETKQCPGNSDSRDCKALPSLVPIDTLVTNEKVDNKSRRIASLYDSLFQIKIPQLFELDSADQDWLFSSELTKEKPVTKKLKTDSDAFQCSKSVWPCAQYFPEVDIYALPYTVPF